MAILQNIQAVITNPSAYIGDVPRMTVPAGTMRRSGELTLWKYFPRKEQLCKAIQKSTSSVRLSSSWRQSSSSPLAVMRLQPMQQLRRLSMHRQMILAPWMMPFQSKSRQQNPLPQTNFATRITSFSRICALWFTAGFWLLRHGFAHKPVSSAMLDHRHSSIRNNYLSIIHPRGSVSRAERCVDAQTFQSPTLLKEFPC